MTNLDFNAAYNEHVQRLTEQRDRDQALQLAVGGEFEVVGVLERGLLLQQGLQPTDYVIDVGCGSGRLAKPLAEYLHGRYLGTDVVPELIDYARNLVHHPDWRFEVVNGLYIPEEDERADVVCFFSVITHLLHEQSYKYLQEAKRVLKPGGKIVFSFLEFANPRHWDVFEWNLEHLDQEHHLNMFVGRDGIRAWAQHLELRVQAFYDGDKPHIPLPYPVFYDNRQMHDLGYLGQSVCVLVKPDRLINTI